MGLSALEGLRSDEAPWLNSQATGRIWHQDSSVPQLVIPEMLYNVLIASLSMAASYHFFTLVIEWWKTRKAKSSS
jgi:hypothetical protein